MTCTKCNQEVQVSWKLCPYCGQLLQEFIASFPCPNCEYRVQESWKVCPQCGFQLKILINEQHYSKNPDFQNSTYFSSLTPEYLQNVQSLLGMDMVFIYADSFIMGSDKYEEEKPKREVYIPGFWMCKYAVTNLQYREYVSDTGCPAACFDQDSDFNQDLQPVAGVSYYEVGGYCEWLSKKTGLVFRLPTEAEWEKAAGGTSERRYPWGNCWEHDRCHSIELHNRRTSDVGCYPYGLSPYGIFNMAGNVWEWCSDWYSPDYYKQAPTSDPQGPETGKEKVVRGGAWNSKGNDMRTSKRKSFPPNTRQSSIGLRVACNDPVVIEEKKKENFFS